MSITDVLLYYMCTFCTIRNDWRHCTINLHQKTMTTQNIHRLKKIVSRYIYIYKKIPSELYVNMETFFRKFFGDMWISENV